MAKFVKVTILPDDPEGWSDWIHPIMASYKMACCDCGLVHDMEFRIRRVKKREKDGSWTWSGELNPVKFRVACARIAGEVDMEKQARSRKEFFRGEVSRLRKEWGMK